MLLLGVEADLGCERLRLGALPRVLQLDDKVGPFGEHSNFGLETADEASVLLGHAGLASAGAGPRAGLLLVLLGVLAVVRHGFVALLVALVAAEQLGSERRETLVLDVRQEVLRDFQAKPVVLPLAASDYLRAVVVAVPGVLLRDVASKALALREALPAVLALKILLLVGHTLHAKKRCHGGHGLRDLLENGGQRLRLDGDLCLGGHRAGQVALGLHGQPYRRGLEGGVAGVRALVEHRAAVFIIIICCFN